ncbi:MAG TPA: TetR/AcrR family transcriptional regulator [Bacteroidales bacterium]|jgi:AcrR family transcriptional regulator|nr:TetR/AcrR family transcriptional regulator [Bacteroidales bacterium]
MKANKTGNDKLFKAGRKLFWKYGFRRVSVDEICREAGVSKMTFYRAFEDKQDLAKTIFRKVAEEGVKQFIEILDSDTPPSEKLKLILQMKAEGTNDISNEFITDFYRSTDTGLPEFVRTVTKESWNNVISGFRRAQESGWMRKDFKPEFLFHISQQLVGMVSDKELLMLYRNQQELIMEFANFITYGIAPHE